MTDLRAIAPCGMRRDAGFTLAELAIVLLIVGLLIGGLMMPLSAQIDSRNTSDTRRTLADIHEALLGFAAANGRLPCPASATSNGQESFAAGGSAANGDCDVSGVFVPAATLGIAPTDQDGFAIDAWGQRIRYAVYRGTINSVSDPFSRTDGIKSATMTAIAAAAMQLSVCSTATGISGSDCGSAVKLTDKAPVVFFSTGKNAGSAAGTDESKNLDGDRVFIFHEPSPSSATNGEFDDLVTWLSPNVLYNRMIAAERLP
jgi:prepilin-type N-terminal cleavage/methylation domain-containing protein